MIYSKEILLFALCGMCGTLVDFTTFNVLCRTMRMRRIAANIIAVTCAMLFNYATNATVVFSVRDPQSMMRVVKYLAVTGFSAYILQTLILKVDVKCWSPVVRFAGMLCERANLAKYVTMEFIERNVCKTMAVAGGMMWNFSFYKLVVFSE